MNDFFRTHRKTKWAAIIVGSLVLFLVLFTLFFDWNLLRPPLARLITAKTGRPASIDGNLRVHLWSWNPSADVEGLKISNPDWAQRDLMFGADRISISVSLGRLLRGQIVLPKVELIAPTINLERDSKERASWEFGDPKGTPPKQDDSSTKLPGIRRLLIQDGKINVTDRIRKLKLSGSITAQEQAGKQDAAAFRLKLSGSLNEKPFKLEFNGGPLVNIDPEHPYDFSAAIVASDIHVDAQVSIPKPFDLGSFQAKFRISGRDLADAYYLTGLALPNTANYDISANVNHGGTMFHVEDLKGRIGASDIGGALHVDTGKERLNLKANLVSKNLNFADLAPTLGTQAAQAPAALSNSGTPATTAGKSKTRAAAPLPQAKADEKLLPDADLQLNRVRRMDADVTYKAASVTAPKLPMKEVNLHIVLLKGVLRIDPLSFELAQGKFAGQVQIDASKDVPLSDIDMRILDVDLAQFKSATAKQAPIAGTMLGRLKFHGTGTSIHKFASTADGGLGIAIPHGEISDVLAELTGINVLKGLGLLIAKDETHTEIRCGVLDFQASNGRLEAKTVFVDTTNVLITGHGNIQLDSEDLDLSLQGDPKKVRFIRLRSPISLGGTMANPAIGIKPEKLLAQAGIGVALGVLLTPAAAVLAFIDPGLAKNKDCAEVIGQERNSISTQ